MDSLRAAVIKLARSNPELRPHLLPLVKQANLAVGDTYESSTGLFRIHRYTDSLEITDLTNAGKRGKKALRTVVWNLDLIRDPNQALDWDRMIHNLTKASSYGAVVNIIRGFIVSAEMFTGSPAPKMAERALRGVDVEPAGFKPLKMETPEFSLDSSLLDFSIRDKRDTYNLPACIPISQGGKASVKAFYRWVRDNEASVRRMTYDQVTSAMLDAGIRFHSYCRMD